MAPAHHLAGFFGRFRPQAMVHAGGLHEDAQARRQRHESVQQRRRIRPSRNAHQNTVARAKQSMFSNGAKDGRKHEEYSAGTLEGFQQPCHAPKARAR
jgi:hypothetical protein